jgi:hypothetical protein
VCEGLIAEKCRKAENMQKHSIGFPQVSALPHPFPQKTETNKCQQNTHSQLNEHKVCGLAE